jgi:hypothetical protein
MEAANLCRLSFVGCIGALGARRMVTEEVGKLVERHHAMMPLGFGTFGVLLLFFFHDTLGCLLLGRPGGRFV